MPIKAKARARGLMGDACIVALRAAQSCGPATFFSLLLTSSAQNVLKLLAESIVTVENRLIKRGQRSGGGCESGGRSNELRVKKNCRK